MLGQPSPPHPPAHGRKPNYFFFQSEEQNRTPEGREEESMYSVFQGCFKKNEKKGRGFVWKESLPARQHQEGPEMPQIWGNILIDGPSEEAQFWTGMRHPNQGLGLGSFPGRVPPPALLCRHQNKKESNQSVLSRQLQHLCVWEGGKKSPVFSHQHRRMLMIFYHSSRDMTELQMLSGLHQIAPFWIHFSLVRNKSVFYFCIVFSSFLPQFFPIEISTFSLILLLHQFSNLYELSNFKNYWWGRP